MLKIDRSQSISNLGATVSGIDISQDIKSEDKELLKEVEVLLGKEINPIQLNAYEIENALSLIYQTSIENDLLNKLSLSSSSKIDFSKDRKPNFILQDILSTALQKNATDIHIENYNKDATMVGNGFTITYDMLDNLSKKPTKKSKSNWKSKFKFS